jgi:cupin 2 domain-containing protein
MTVQRINLFTPSLPSDGNTEQIFSLLETLSFRLEHIVSHGSASAEGFWYDEPTSEWVLLLRGQATLDFGEAGELDLQAGDGLLIPAHSRHRVAHVSEDARWLALHFSEASPSVENAKALKR